MMSLASLHVCSRRWPGHIDKQLLHFGMFWADGVSVIIDKCLFPASVIVLQVSEIHHFVCTVFQVLYHAECNAGVSDHMACSQNLCAMLQLAVT